MANHFPFHCRGTAAYQLSDIHWLKQDNSRKNRMEQYIRTQHHSQRPTASRLIFCGLYILQAQRKHQHKMNATVTKFKYSCRDSTGNVLWKHAARSMMHGCLTGNEFCSKLQEALLQSLISNCFCQNNFNRAFLSGKILALGV